MTELEREYQRLQKERESYNTRFDIAAACVLLAVGFGVIGVFVKLTLELWRQMP